MTRTIPLLHAKTNFHARNPISSASLLGAPDLQPRPLLVCRVSCVKPGVKHDDDCLIIPQMTREDEQNIPSAIVTHFEPD